MADDAQIKSSSQQQNDDSTQNDDQDLTSIDLVELIKSSGLRPEHKEELLSTLPTLNEKEKEEIKQVLLTAQKKKSKIDQKYHKVAQNLLTEFDQELKKTVNEHKRAFRIGAENISKEGENKVIANLEKELQRVGETKT